MGLLKGINGEADALWSGSSIVSILENPVYCGCMVERKSEQSYYKGGRKQMIPKDQWNYIENTHEPIIDWELFTKVQAILEESRQTRNNKGRNHREQTENPLKGLIVCGCCQGRMIRDSGYFDQAGNLIHHRFICRRKYLKQQGCEAESVLEADLLPMVTESVTNQLKVLGGSESHEQPEKVSDTTRQLEQNQASFLEREIKELERYQDYKRGLLSKEEYVCIQRKREEQKAALEKEKVRLKNQQTEEKQKEVERIEADDTGDMWKYLIERIVVCHHWVEIHYTFCSEYDQPLA